MSPRTFSRYFATKEDVVLALTADLVEVVAAQLLRQPRELSELEALRPRTWTTDTQPTVPVHAPIPLSPSQVDSAVVLLSDLIVSGQRSCLSLTYSFAASSVSAVVFTVQSCAVLGHGYRPGGTSCP